MKLKEFKPDRLGRLAYHLIKNEKRLKKNKCVYVPTMIDKEYENEEFPYYLYITLELVKVFPKQWLIGKDGFAYWVYDKRRTIFSSVMDFFGLPTSGFFHLFVPGCQNIALFGGTLLNDDASPTEIANNMLQLINTLEIQKN